MNLQHFLVEMLPWILPAGGIAIIFYSLFKKTTFEKLKGEGVYTDGIVCDLAYSKTPDSSNSPSIITIKFTTQKNEWITAVVKNEFGIYYSGQYTIGEKVRIMYNPEDPYECLILTKQSEKTARLLFIVIGFALCIIGLYISLKE